MSFKGWLVSQKKGFLIVWAVVIASGLVLTGVFAALLPGPAAEMARIPGSVQARVAFARVGGFVGTAAAVLFIATGWWQRQDLPRVVLWFVGGLTTAWGLAFLAGPQLMASRLGIPLSDITARADFAATYGGAITAVGAYLLWCAWRNDVRTGLLLAVFVLVGFFSTRTFMWATGDKTSPGSQFSLRIASFIEFPGALLSWLAYWNTTKGQAKRS